EDVAQSRVLFHDKRSLHVMKRGRFVSAIISCTPVKYTSPWTRDAMLPKSVMVTTRQWSGQKSGGDSAVRPEFVIAGMIFHPSRVQSELLHKYIEQSFVEVTLLPARHREDVRLLTLRHAQILRAHQIERRQRGVEMKV